MIRKKPRNRDNRLKVGTGYQYALHKQGTICNEFKTNESTKEIDINPLILSGDKPVAVDALVVFGV